MKTKVDKILMVTGLTLWSTKEGDDEPFTEIEDRPRRYDLARGDFSVERILIRTRWPLGAKVRVTIEMLDGARARRGQSHAK